MTNACGSGSSCIYTWLSATKSRSTSPETMLKMNTKCASHPAHAALVTPIPVITPQLYRCPKCHTLVLTYEIHNHDQLRCPKMVLWDISVSLQHLSCVPLNLISRQIVLNMNEMNFRRFWRVLSFQKECWSSLICMDHAISVFGASYFMLFGVTKLQYRNRTGAHFWAIWEDSKIIWIVHWFQNIDINRNQVQLFILRQLRTFFVDNQCCETSL